jgi:L-ascorbate metabolism protein UlaG (beta-lactamase superfamily)
VSMKITRFAQSCILIESNGKRILIDPGEIYFKESYLRNEWSNIDAVFVSHIHKAHCNVGAILSMNTQVYSVGEVASLFEDGVVSVITEGDQITVGGITVTAVKSIHGWSPFLEEEIVRDNIGFLVSDGATAIVNVGVSLYYSPEYSCDVVFASIAGRGLSMKEEEILGFVKKTGSRLFVPIHSEMAEYVVDKKKKIEMLNELGVSSRFLEVEESIEV